MSAALRLLDTGVLPPRRNVAITAALAELHAAGEIPDTLRFQRFERSVLLGRNQELGAAVLLDRCRQRGVALARRITGGGAVYMDPDVLSWEIVAGRRRFGTGFAEAAARICGAVAEAIACFGVAAQFSPPNAIVVDGRKVSGASGYFEGPTLVHEGTVLVDSSSTDMAVVLRLAEPQRAVARLTSLTALLGSAPSMADLQSRIALSISSCFGFSAAAGELTTGERTLSERLHQSEFGTDDFVFGAGMTVSESSDTTDRVPA